MTAVTIYALCSPGGEIRYIGKAAKPSKRFYDHTHGCNPGTRVAKWVKRLRPDRPIFRSLVVVQGTDANEMEIRTIAHFKAKGYRLLNGTPGGDGLPLGYKHSGKTRRKMSRAHKGRRRAPFSAEWRANIGVAGRGRVLSEETRAKMSASRVGNKNSVGRRHGPETLAKMSAAQRERRAKERTIE